jgi:DNA-binding response OmpR family regulator
MSATVLVVDDEPSARQTIEALLLPEAYRLRFAASGIEALERLGEERPDLVLCDVMMPGMDGFEVCCAIKSRPDGRLVPVILLTALDGVEHQVRGLESGADDFVCKPVVGAVLRARTRAMLRVRGHYTALAERPGDPETLLRARRDRLIAEARLTGREIEVLDLLLLGRAHEDIALLLTISERTSRFHQSNLLRKLGAESRFDLVRLFA